VPARFAPSYNGSSSSRPVVRVFVPTYRRHALLCRALASLKAQTFSHWVCDVHNDDPTDTFPGEFVRILGDPRVVLHQHNRNLGAAETFNFFYRPTPEPYYSLLEDDNWWEPEFLETMLRAMKEHPSVTLAWCNQRIWLELPDGSWCNTGRLVGSEKITAPNLVTFGEAKQIMGAVHSHGAMLVRSRPGQIFATPPGWPLAAIEPLRERMMPHPLLYVPSPLAAFSITRQTARDDDPIDWAVAQAMLAATFIKHADYTGRQLADLMAAAREFRPPHTSSLILAALIEPRCRMLIRYAKVKDWLLLLRGALRRPHMLWSVLGSRRRQSDWWRLLDQHTADRFAERHPLSSEEAASPEEMVDA
jgi:glycosyltransferase involved in cell wall biosynthesis